MNSILYRDIKPTGWLYKQLKIQAKGLSGHLDQMWPDVRDSAWIGGNREGWERVPYWLDGFIPLAYLLQDEELIQRANRYIQCIADRQREDGWICPCSEEEQDKYDIWAVLLICKVLALHCSFTNDPRIEETLYRTMKNLYELLDSGVIHLFDWARFRWFEGIIPLMHLYKRRPEAWMISLGRMLQEQGADYPSLQGEWKRPMNKWRQETHIVNLCMMLKHEALVCTFFDEKPQGHTKELWQVLETYNGTAVGTFTGDECLSGIGNQQGTELCAVVELMYTCEWLYRITGDAIWAERLEKVAFNALPATFTDDMWAHQYVQMVNQPACIEFPGKSFFRTNSSESHLFGLEPNFGCCTANMHQAWPKLALHAIQRIQKGVVIAHLLPVSANLCIDDNPVSIRVETDYPFRMQAKIIIETQEALDFEVQLRIPIWAKNTNLNGKPIKARHGHFSLSRKWQGTETLCLTMEAAPMLKKRPHGLSVLTYGPFVFSLPIKTEYRKKEYEKDGVERKFPYCDYELIPHSEWRYGFASDAFTVEERPVSNVPFSSIQSPLIIRTQMAPVVWPWADGYDTVPALKPESHKASGEKVEKELIPYGCAKLRMTELPIISNNHN